MQAVVLLLVFQLGDGLPRADEFLVLIIEALEAVAADAALFPVQRFRLVQDRGVLGDHVRSVALLASGIKIFFVIQRPEPVFVAAVALFDRVQRASISAVAWRAAEFFQRMIFHHVRIGVAGEWRVVALR